MIAAAKLSPERIEALRAKIRSVPDFPKPGILFRDISTLLADQDALRVAMELLSEASSAWSFDKVVGIESRGFLFGPTLAYEEGAGFVLARKPGKLPARVERVEFHLEYGTDALEMHADAIGKGESCLIVDDLLATGGTAKAVGELVERIGGKVAGFLFLVELVGLAGRKRLVPWPVRSIITFD